MRGALTLLGLSDFPLVHPGDDLCDLVIASLDRNGVVPERQDILVIAQKVVSKAEGRYVDLRSVQPSPRALELAAEVHKDPRLVEVILGEARRVVRQAPGVLIVEHRLGCVMANAGVDQSNIDHPDMTEPALLLPRDPDASAFAMCERVGARFGKAVGVVISDSWGRAWRRGTVGVALGAAGLPAVADLRGRPDLFGRRLQSTETGFADEVASAASLVMGQADERMPVVVVRGLSWSAPATAAATLIRPVEEDLFR
jgi:coenzyme F420-0:L-glutamate ligase / coenzyme F420-1:gamma-L-glutamate ligase